VWMEGAKRMVEGEEVAGIMKAQIPRFSRDL
jgi:hypothetical protein